MNHAFPDSECLKGSMECLYTKTYLLIFPKLTKVSFFLLNGKKVFMVTSASIIITHDLFLVDKKKNLIENAKCVKQHCTESLKKN